MTAWDWTGYTVDGGTRPDAITGLQDPFEASLAALFAAAPPNVQQALRISSAYRSPERQAQLWQEALAKYGSPEAARKWVAPPGRSQHNHGNAVDLRYLDPVAQEWVHANAARFGLHFPMSHEPWHIEPLGARGATSAPAYAGAGAAAGIAPQTAPTGQQNALAAMSAPVIDSPQNALAAMGWRSNQIDPTPFLFKRNALGMM